MAAGGVCVCVGGGSPCGSRCFASARHRHNCRKVSRSREGSGSVCALCAFSGFERQIAFLRCVFLHASVRKGRNDTGRRSAGILGFAQGLLPPPPLSPDPLVRIQLQREMVSLVATGEKREPAGGSDI